MNVRKILHVDMDAIGRETMFATDIVDRDSTLAFIIVKPLTSLVSLLKG